MTNPILSLIPMSEKMGDESWYSRSIIPMACVSKKRCGSVHSAYKVSLISPSTLSYVKPALPQAKI